jgi:Domain of unknown function (DUF4136)
MLKNYVFWGALFGCSLGMAACYPGEIDSAAQTDLVVTFHKDDADFQANLTFDIPDSIVDVSAAAGGSSTLNHTYDAQILAKIAQSLEAMGYTRVDATSVQPDAIVLVSAITVENTAYYTPGYPWYPYWGWWGGWGPYSYGAGSTWYYPWYPVYTTNFTSGSLFVTMIDPDVPAPDSDQGVAIWSGIINGMLEGTDAEILARINNSISQAFVQSPYLRIQ